LAEGRAFLNLGDSVPGSSLVLEICYPLAFSALFLLYTRLLVRWELEPLSLVQVRRLIVPASLASVIALPATSTDLLYYVALGRIVVLSGGNPYVQRYSDFGDHFMAYLDWWDQVTMPYGPSLLAAFIPAGWLSQYSVFLALYFLKLVALAAYYACCWALLQLLRRMGRDQAYGLFLFALNPLVLVDHLANGHNDGPMILCGLLALSAVLDGRHLRSVCWALLATFTKVPAIVGLGLIMSHLFWKRHWAALARGLALALGVGVLLIVTLLPSLQDGVARIDTLNSLHTVLFEVLVDVFRWESTDNPDFQRALALDRNISVACFFVFLAWRLWAGRQRRDVRGIIREQLVVLLVLLIVQATWFLPWYVTWLLPLAALVESTTLTWTVIVYSWSVTALCLPSMDFGSRGYVTRILIAHCAPLIVLLRAQLKRASLVREPASEPA
ncbi:MAG TPA: glycosyltransferase 87 family protein, partial [Polyangiales bacterium]|nr:glycosyltransferase 87 family protein [Polyangiales bacterium]